MRYIHKEDPIQWSNCDWQKADRWKNLPKFQKQHLIQIFKWGRPPGYDSADWHNTMQKSSRLYVLLEDGTAIGGAVFVQDEKSPETVHIDRIFIAPPYHRKGYGIKLMKEIETAFENLHILQLDTPVWNIRTNAFYRKCDFQEVSRNQDFVRFKKVLTEIPGDNNIAKKMEKCKSNRIK